MKRVARALALAFACLTILPLRFRDGAVGEAEIADSRYAYPIVGLVLGLILAALSAILARWSIPPLLTAFWLTTAGAILTGGLHLDGLADTADGLFLGGGSERRLAAMRDPHLGSFGAIALVLVLVGKFAALASLTGSRRQAALLLALTLSRTLLLVAAGSAQYARSEGTGRILIQASTPRDAIGASVLALGLGIIIAGIPGLLAATCLMVLAWILVRLASLRLGGITGDLLGALVELGELAVLMVLSGGAGTG
jgi:adenosylcobinamide-GDP ribazoletransferase